MKPKIERHVSSSDIYSPFRGGFSTSAKLKCGKYVREMRKRPPRGSLRVCQRLEDQRTRSGIHVRLVRDEIPGQLGQAARRGTGSEARSCHGTRESYQQRISQ